MEFNRNHYFMLGLLLLLVGVQLRMVDTYVLNEEASRVVSERFHSSDNESGVRPFLPAVGPTPRRTIRPPESLGWALISVGCVLVLHSLAMKKPGG